VGLESTESQHTLPQFQCLTSHQQTCPVVKRCTAPNTRINQDQRGVPLVPHSLQTVIPGCQVLLVPLHEHVTLEATGEGCHLGLRSGRPDPICLLIGEAKLALHSPHGCSEGRCVGGLARNRRVRGQICLLRNSREKTGTAAYSRESTAGA
jgi:hypothetical protein